MSLLSYFRLTARSRRAYAVYLENMGVYSTDETDTGLQWIDGSTIYRKVVAIANGPNNNTVSFPHGITGLNVVTAFHYFPVTAGSIYLAMPNGTDGGSGPAVRVFLDAANINFSSTGSYAGFSGHAIIEYTKT